MRRISPGSMGACRREKKRPLLNVRLETLEIVDREFRPTSWVDLQPAIEKLMASLKSVEVFGIHSGRFFYGSGTRAGRIAEGAGLFIAGGRGDEVSQFAGCW
jgi:hypothetical protein